MNLAADELRLVYFIALNVAVFAAGLRFARRRSRELIDAIVDAFLIYYLVQYVTVGVLGILGILTPISIAVVAIGISVALFIIAKPQAAGKHSENPHAVSERTREEADVFSRSIAILASFFVVGYALALCHNQRFLPVMFNDALTYHVPAAVHWLQTKHLALFETWFYNPANTYSPLAGSMFIAWLIAPMGNDVFAKFVEMGPLLMIMFAMIALARRLGANLAIASIIALAAVMSRPFISQTIAAKDDLFVSAFALTVLLGVTDRKIYRAGVALGLLLATKYTAIYSLPVILLSLNRKWRPRDCIAACGVAIPLVSPWYLRNLITTGNPFFPMRMFGLPGLINPARSDRLGTWHQMIDTLVTGYYAPGAVVAIALVIIWLAAIVVLRKRLLNDPLIRTLVFSPPLLVAIFLASSPYAEMRFIYPALLLLFACAAAVLTKLPWKPAVLIAVLLLFVSFFTHGFLPEQNLLFSGVGFVVAGIAVALWTTRIIRSLRVKVIVGSAGAMILFVLIYINWPHYLESVADAVRAPYTWPLQYGAISEAWIFVHDHTPPDTTIAYTNTHFVHPLHGFRNTRRAIYIPTRRGIKHLADLPPLTQPIPGEKLTAAIDAQIVADPDHDQWLAALLGSSARYLFMNIDNADHPIPPPELAFAEADQVHFRPVFRNAAAVVYEINR